MELWQRDSGCSEVSFCLSAWEPLLQCQSPRRRRVWLGSSDFIQVPGITIVEVITCFSWHRGTAAWPVEGMGVTKPWTLGVHRRQGSHGLSAIGCLSLWPAGMVRMISQQFPGCEGKHGGSEVQQEMKQRWKHAPSHDGSCYVTTYLLNLKQLHLSVQWPDRNRTNANMWNQFEKLYTRKLLRDKNTCNKISMKQIIKRAKAQYSGCCLGTEKDDKRSKEVDSAS